MAEGLLSKFFQNPQAVGVLGNLLSGYLASRAPSLDPGAGGRAFASGVQGAANAWSQGRADQPYMDYLSSRAESERAALDRDAQFRTELGALLGGGQPAQAQQSQMSPQDIDTGYAGPMGATPQAQARTALDPQALARIGVKYGSDPMAAAQSLLPQPGYSGPLAQNSVLFDNGQPIYRNDPVPDPKDFISGDYIWDGQRWAANPDAATLAQAGAPRTDVRVGQSEYGVIPSGWELFRTEGGGLSMRPIEGGPAAREIDEAAQQEAGRERGVQRQADIVTEDIDRALHIAENSDWPVTGIVGSVASGFAGSSAHDVARLVDTIKANVGFDKLQDMRANSPTGGALGQVSEMENRLLQATLGNLEQSQSKEQFLFNLRRLKRVYNEIVHGPEAAAQMEQQGGGDNDPLGIRQ